MQMQVRPIHFSMTAAAFLVFAVLFVLFIYQREDAAVSLSDPVILGSEYRIAITNRGSRRIDYVVLPAQMKCDGNWTENNPLPDTIPGPNGRPVKVSYATSWKHDRTLGPGSGGFAVRPLPHYISVPQGATAWRFAIEWSYSVPSKMQQWQNKVAGLFFRKPPLPPLRYTNYTSEVSF